LSQSSLELGLRLAQGLPAIAGRIAEKLAGAGVSCVRPDFMPLAIPLHGRPLPALTVTAPGWGKINFESLKLMHFDADEGLIDVTPRYQLVGNDHPDRAGLNGERVLSKWMRNPSWSIETAEPLPLSHLVFVNRPDRRGARSARLILSEPNPVPAPEGKKKVKVKPLFRMDDSAFLARQTIAAANQVALIAGALVDTVKTEPVATYEGLNISIAADGLPAEFDYRDLHSVDETTVELVLTAVVRSAATLLCGELRKRVPEDDWSFRVPAGCFSLLLTLAVGGGDQESAPAIRIGVTNSAGKAEEVPLDLRGAKVPVAGLRITPVPPEAPLYKHRWSISAEPGVTITHATIERENPRGWPIHAAQLGIRDVSHGARPIEINLVAAALEMLRLCGRLAGQDRQPGSPLIAGYSFAWSQFLNNAFGPLRSFWQAKMVPGLEFTDISAAVADFNANLPVKCHRILSKHGFKKPIYARDLTAVMRQIGQLEEMIQTETGRKLFLSYGTLLGCIRDQAFIPHDDDIDVAWVSDVQSFEDMLVQRRHLLDKLKSYPNVSVTDPYETRGRVNCTIRIAKAGPSVNLDLFPIWRTPDGHVHGMMERLKIRAMKQDWFTEFKRTDFYGAPVWVPSKAEAFLEDRYGPGWVKPDPSYGLG
jgi:hypothetical protein